MLEWVILLSSVFILVVVVLCMMGWEGLDVFFVEELCVGGGLLVRMWNFGCWWGR